MSLQKTCPSVTQLCWLECKLILIFTFYEIECEYLFNKFLTTFRRHEKLCRCFNNDAWKQWKVQRVIYQSVVGIFI